MGLLNQGDIKMLRFNKDDRKFLRTQMSSELKNEFRTVAKAHGHTMAEEMRIALELHIDRFKKKNFY